MKMNFIIMNLLFFLSNGLSPSQAQTWQSVPGPTGGYVLSISINPQNQQLLYAGTKGGDLYKSTDGGITWARILSLGSDVGSVTIDSLHPNTVFIGTATGGLFKTTDNGNSWNNVSPTSKQITALIVDSQNDLNVYVSVKGDGIYKSTDGGNTWSLVTVGLSDNQITSLAIDPTNPMVLYAGGNNYIFRTQSGGLTWSALTATSNVVTSIAVDKNNHSTIVAGTMGGVCKSTDGGNTWLWMNNSLGNTKVHSLLASSSSSSILYAATEGGLYKSLTGGSSWTLNYAPPYQTTINTITANPSNSSELYLGCNGDGIFHTTTSGASWQTINTGLFNMNIWKIAAVNQNILFAGTEVGGVFKSTNAGNSWSLAKQSQNVYALAVDPTHLNIIYAGTYGTGIYKSQDTGKTWQQCNTNLTNINVWDIAIDPTNTSIIYAATDAGIFKSADGASSWVQAYSSFLEGCYSVAVNQTNHNIVYSGSGTYDGLIKVSTDGGSTWNTLGSGINFENIYALKPVPLSTNTVFAGGVYFGFSTYSGLYALPNSSSSWTKEIDNFYCSEITYRADKPTEIYASSFNAGVYYSTDGGNSWNLMTATLPYTISDAVCVTGNKVYAAFRNAGIYQTATVTDVKEEGASLPKGFSLNQNYPNPFNPTTTISFSLPRSEYATLKIFDLMGREITTLISKNLATGNYSFKWDARNQPSGVYFCRLQAGQYSETKKLLLLK